jgi:hypothetical protein
MPPLAKMTLEMINILYVDKQYTEALVGLRLLRKTNNNKQFRRLVDNLIECCESKIKLKQ